MRKKVTVVGSGNVGATHRTEDRRQRTGDVVMVDILEKVPAGKALDMLEAAPSKAPTLMFPAALNDYAPTANSDIVVITAGLPRKPGMSRDDLVKTNYNIMKSGHRRSREVLA